MGTTTHSPTEVNVALQGTLDTFALPDVLRLLAATKKTGRLRITGGRGTGSVWVSSGEVEAIEATHAPHATGPVDALFELLRFEDGAFTFDAEATHDDPGPATDVEILLVQSEGMLAEWREIEAVVSSMDAWVTLRSQLPMPEIAIDQERWTTIVAIGAGATVRRIGDELCLAELPISRAIKELCEIGLVDIAAAAPAGSLPMSVSSAPLAARAPLAPKPTDPPDGPPAPPAPPAANGSRSRRPKPTAAPTGPEVFVPLDLPGQNGAAPSYDDRPTRPAVPDARPAALDEDFTASFPGLADHAAPAATADDQELAKQLATLSPRAANAIRAAAEATTDEERQAALDEVDSDGEPLNRGLLLKFLSSVKS
jgi:Domain of unknown function (DUF4388)